MEPLPTLVTTMLGASASGKTVFMHALYGTLAMGVRGFSLHAFDNDPLAAHRMDQELRAVWGDMVGEGILPDPTPIEVPANYSLLFKHRRHPLVRLDWQDYRGGALTSLGDDATEPDVRDLVNRIAGSDVLYVVLSAEHLTEPVWIGENGSGRRAPRYARISAKLAADAINTKINAAQSQGGLSGSLIVILITKADLLEGTRRPANAGPEQRLEFFRGLTRDVAALLPHAFADGTTTMVCPVSLGPLGAPDLDKIDPDLIRPRWVYKPLLLPAFHHIASRTRELSTQQNAASRNLRAAEQDLAGIEARSRSFLRWLFARKTDAAAIEAQRKQIEEWLTVFHGAEERTQAAADMQRVINDEMSTVPVLKNGRSLWPDLDLSVQEIVDA
jgi:hypothetical protein